MVPTAWQDEALARDGVSREVPCSALKGETVPDSLPVPGESQGQGSLVGCRLWGRTESDTTEVTQQQQQQQHIPSIWCIF